MSSPREYGDHVYTWDQWERTKSEKGEDAANQEQSEAIENGAILVKDAIADITLQQVLTGPSEFDVIATMNLNARMTYVRCASGVRVALGSHLVEI